jgi:hypothetical protein
MAMLVQGALRGYPLQMRLLRRFTLLIAAACAALAVTVLMLAVHRAAGDTMTRLNGANEAVPATRPLAEIDGELP